MCSSSQVLFLINTVIQNTPPVAVVNMAEPVEKEQPQGDLASKVLKTASPESGSVAEANFNINEKALLRKLDLKLLPPLTLLYLLSFLDRSNGQYTVFLDNCSLTVNSWKCETGRTDYRHLDDGGPVSDRIDIVVHCLCLV
jgi:hypothetical protein